MNRRDLFKFAGGGVAAFLVSTYGPPVPAQSYLIISPAFGPSFWVPMETQAVGKGGTITRWVPAIEARILA